MKIENFVKPYLKKEFSSLKAGDEVRISQKIKEGDKERVQTFEGIIIGRAHGREIGATITVRRVISGIGVERIFPLYSPIIEKIEITKKGKTRRAKLYYLRKAKGKKAKLKREESTEITEEKKK